MELQESIPSTVNQRNGAAAVAVTRDFFVPSRVDQERAFDRYLILGQDLPPRCYCNCICTCPCSRCANGSVSAAVWLN